MISMSFQQISDNFTIIINFERYNFLNILKMDDGVMVPSEILKCGLSKLIFSNKFPLLKFKFNTNILTIVFVRNQTNFDKVFDCLNFNSASDVLLIFDDLRNSSATLKRFAEKKFLNTIFINKRSSKVYHFEYFPEFSVVEKDFSPTSKVSFSNKVKNVYQKVIKISCVNSMPRCMAGIDDHGNKKFVGYLSHILRNFARFVNGTFHFQPFNSSIPEQNMTQVLADELADFVTLVKFYISENSTEQMLLNQNTSNVLGVVRNLVIVPSPKPINRMNYPMRPFGMAIWLVLTIFIFYSGFLVHFGLYLKEADTDFGLYLESILRAILSQSYPLHSKQKILFLTFVFTLIEIFGFMMTLWYSAMLGSFVTTTLYDSPIDSLDDIRKSNLKILLGDSYGYLLQQYVGIESYRDLFLLYPLKEFRRFKLELNEAFAYVEASDRWMFYLKPRQQFYGVERFRAINKNLLSAASYINLNHDSVYKPRLNYFLQISKDVGLFNRWCDRTFLDTLIYNIFKKPIISNEHHYKRKILTVNFFKMLFLGWFIGIVFGGLAFVVEVFLKFRLNTSKIIVLFKK